MSGAALIIAALALLAAPAAAQYPLVYTATLTPTFTTPSGVLPPSGSATVTIMSATSAVVDWDVRHIANATMAHIHNGTVPAMPGGVVAWAFDSTLPTLPEGEFQPISGSFSGSTPFDPTATGIADLLANNMAYFNVHSLQYPDGAIQGNFMSANNMTMQTMPVMVYTATLTPTFETPSGVLAPSGMATVTIMNETSAVIEWDIEDIANATMAHIHNGTVPAMPGGVVAWAFQSTLPTLPSGEFQPISGSFSGVTPFDPTVTGIMGLLENNMAYFNVHSIEYPDGAIQGNFMRKLY